MKLLNVSISFLVGAILGGVMLYLGGYLDFLISEDGRLEVQSETGPMEFSDERYDTINAKG